MNIIEKKALMEECKKRIEYLEIGLATFQDEVDKNEIEMSIQELKKKRDALLFDITNADKSQRKL